MAQTKAGNRTQDEHLANGSIICWSRRKRTRVPVCCGHCGVERDVLVQSATAHAFTGICRRCSRIALRKHTDMEILPTGSIVYWNERQGSGRNQAIPVRCGICGRLRSVPAYRACRTITGYCADCARTGSRSHHWKGGRLKHSSGYVLIRLTPDHAFYCMADSHHLVPEHRLIMAEHIGRALERDEIVHHKNGVKDDNRIENLELLKRNLHHAGFTPSEQQEDTAQQVD